MLDISDDQFEALIVQAMDELSPEHMAAVQNVAIVYADEPTSEQRQRLRLHAHETLFGLYEGVPLARRQGVTNYPPDKITIFKNPLLSSVHSQTELKAAVKHTLWHEIAHYFGLDHDRIYELERKKTKK